MDGGGTSPRMDEVDFAWSIKSRLRRELEVGDSKAEIEGDLST
jgi:hypothetical protein